MPVMLPQIALSEFPIYHELYGDKLSGLELWRDYADLPVLEKQVITSGFPQNWTAPAVRDALQAGALEFAMTSGTTSDRMQVMRKKDWWQDEYRRTYRYNRQMAAFEVGGDRKALLTTAVCSNTACFMDLPTYEQRITHNTLYLNTNPDPNQWSKAEIERMVSELTRFEPIYIDADPVYLALFLRALEKFAIPMSFPLPQYITLSYELSTQFCRRFIREHWDIPIFDLYGATEIGYLYLEDENGVQQRTRDLSAVEYAPFDVERGLYYMLVTSLKNEYMPFVRYRIGDLVKLDVAPDQIVAGQIHDDIPVAYLCGRAKDVIESPSGRPVTQGELDRSLAQVGDSVLFYQVVVMQDNLLLFRYVTRTEAPLPPSEQEAIRACLIKLFEHVCDVGFVREVAIAPTISGKFSNLKRA
ncbi:Coenzyme F390 synthetase-like protein [Haliangium ochraceum DSM 14365]|uniref:Coenzyme F390 synthetase-like protein n=2 Tax=Haliangium ochraceum TaxID=80816 RepID=D0LTF9_HALO1|nr:Coenzyme F390 synthetase-like protein [Haliangium ochraceum DSM 14365]